MSETEVLETLTTTYQALLAWAEEAVKAHEPGDPAVLVQVGRSEVCALCSETAEEVAYWALEGSVAWPLPETPKPQDEALAVLLEAAESIACHTPSTDDRGLTCDERGCALCNVGAADAVEHYLRGLLRLPEPPYWA